MRTKPFNSEVLYPDEPTVQVTHADVAWLKAQAAQNERRRIRLCAHKNIDDSLHEMLIVHTRDIYVRPHKHLNKSESFHVIEGQVDVILFSDDGKITDVIQMSDYASGCCFYYRMAGSALPHLAAPLRCAGISRNYQWPFHPVSDSLCAVVTDRG